MEYGSSVQYNGLMMDWIQSATCGQACGREYKLFFHTWFIPVISLRYITRGVCSITSHCHYDADITQSSPDTNSIMASLIQLLPAARSHPKMYSTKKSSLPERLCR